MPGKDEYVYGYEYEFDLENPFTSPADEPIASLLDAEAHHAPSVSAAASAVRRDAARFISKVRYDGELAVHPRVAYLALNYVDRFLSKGQLPFERKPWAPRLLAISCLSIAAKMQRVDAISMDYIQRDEEFMFDAVTIQRMERVVLGALEWRARSVTPLAFLGFFLSACFPPPRHLALLDAVKERAVDLLLRAQPECGEVMAAVCGVVGVSLGPAASAETPVTVLGHGHYRSASSESDRTVGSAANVADAKKRCMGPPSQSQWG
uniref:Cyclin-like domain-containing protein n=1 Tax=Aegilops tauschii subsp. strangulata TaxID=200361 RepID=A0A453BAZ7_AEGTS